MLISLAYIFLTGLILGYFFQRLKLPSLIGLLFTGILLGPFSLNLIDSSTLLISPDLRQLALIIILTRAGLSLDIKDLKKVGRPAILMCFVPASFEIMATTLIAPILLGVTSLEAAIMGSVIAAVSPAVIVPRMLKLLENGYGSKKAIPQLILAGASVDDVFVIILFSSFTSLAVRGTLSLLDFTKIPISIITGIAFGCTVGYCLTLIFKKFHFRDSVKVIVILSLGFLIIAIEKKIERFFPISGLLAIMSMGVMIYNKYSVLAERLSSKFSKLWVGAEILLFALVGTTVDINYAISAGLPAVLLIFFVLLTRMLGVFVCLLGTNLNYKERLFCMISYIPKATVQAAIGGLPLAMGLSCGQIVLIVAILSILITAPLGAISIDIAYKKLLKAE